MRISINWLKQYIELDEPVNQIAELLTMSGLEVEGVEKFEEVTGSLSGLVLGVVVDCQKHPEADRLSLAKVDIGNSAPLSIVCGAPNVARGQTVVVAPVGSTIFPTKGDPFKIKKAKIRGVTSDGMICAEDEIGVGVEHDGIMVLDTNLPPGTAANEYFRTTTDHILEIGLTPNRSDAISHIGVARDLKALLDRPINWPITEAPESGSVNPIKVEVENYQACPRYSGLTIENIVVGDSPDWLQSRLRSIGLTPINNIVDITNFVMHEMGQPMHAFDLKAIKKNTVVVKTLAEGTPFITLDEKERKLKHFDLMICDGEQNGMCIAGVFGGIKSGVTSSTSGIFLESACFSADYVRKTAQHHGLKTDASFRFERGTDPNLTVTALFRAASLIKELTGGTVRGELVDIYPEEIKPLKIQLTFANIDRLVGQKIPEVRLKRILTDLDFVIENEQPTGFEVLVPSYRTDVTREADVIEEILRIYGYNNIELDENYGTGYLADFPLVDPDRTRFGLAKMLASLGFFEIYTNSLTKPEYSIDNPAFDGEQSVLIINKLSEDLGVLRQTLLFTGLESVAHNINHRQTNLRLLEFGKTYQVIDPKATGLEKYQEQQHLALFMTGNNQDDSWLDKTRPLQFHDLSLVIRKILEKFNISAYNSRVIQDGVFEFGLSITVSDKSLARFGKLTPKVCAQTDVKQTVFYAEVNWDLLVNKPNDDIVFREVSKYPEVRRDLSLVLDKHISFNEIEMLARSTERQLLRRINVFDVYEGDKIGKDKKAYALSFVLQDKNRTLTDRIIDKCMSRLMRIFEQDLGAFIRT
ncbi:MAG: phenylalanine--tRNA ligase beta subunit [Cyclobacteriaceae bacterium]|nr:MAG: phenylalanine--tRNA ligase beta subunit [Cyclobacteriaceae bacterium]